MTASASSSIGRRSLATTPCYLERGDADEFRDERRVGWTPYLPLW